MSTSRQSFSQVKDLLKKLDQSIDDARTKRLRTPGSQGDNGVRTPPPAPPARHEPSRSENGAAGAPGVPGVPGSSAQQAVRATPRTTPPGAGGPGSFQRRVG